MTKKVKFVFREPPKKPAREKTEEYLEDNSDFDYNCNLKQLVDHVEKKLKLDTVEVQYHYGELWYSKYEDDASYNKKLETYQTKLNEYKQWQSDFKVEIEKYEQEKLKKERAKAELKAKRLKAKIEAAEEELKKLTILKITGL